MHRTKIVATIGPASHDPAVLKQLFRAGVNVVRLNFSHGTHDEHAQTIRHVRTIADHLELPVAILQDLAGPKIRVGEIAKGTVTLQSEQEFTLTTREVNGDTHRVSVSYPDLPRDIQEGDIVLLNDGALELRVERVQDTDIHCRVTVGGPLSSHKGVNLPSRSVSIPILTEKDRKDLAFGIEHGVDLVAMSFVRSAKDVISVRDLMAAQDTRIPIIAKIEKHEALNNIDEILAHVDGIMIARGDLGVETPIQHIPRTQKMLTTKANRAGKPVITATQMLKSMVSNPRPTRAEVTDVANAILDGSDAIMLSEETAVGEYPVETVRMMTRIIESTEEIFPFRKWTAKFDSPPGDSLTEQEAVAHAACRLAEDTDATAIITCTQFGSTTRHVAKYRPPQPIIAMTPDASTYRRLALVWGAVPALIAPVDRADEMEQQALERALALKLLSQGDTAVITAGLPLHESGTTNLIKLAHG